jgi:hypothetical protein
VTPDVRAENEYAPDEAADRDFRADEDESNPDMTERPAVVSLVALRAMGETIEHVARDEYPLDNRGSSQPVTVVEEVVKTVTTELSYDRTAQVDAAGGVELWNIIKADLSAEFTRQTGQHIGEQLTRRQTVTFSAGPHEHVLYVITWKRRIARGMCDVTVNDDQVSIPCQVAFDLMVAVATEARPAGRRVEGSCSALEAVVFLVRQTC